MDRKFIKKARPFGEERPPAPPAMRGPGGGAPPAPGAPPAAPAGPGANSAPGGPKTPPNGPPAPGGGPTPPGAQQAPHDPSNPVAENSAPKPRTPGDAAGGPGGGPGGNTPTDVQIDAATGHITIKKGPINFTIARLSFDLSGGLKTLQAMAEGSAQITAQEGLHARPASMFVRAMKQFESEVMVSTEDGRSANAKSPLKVMSLGAMQGSMVNVTAEGPDEQEAVDMAVQILQGGDQVTAAGEWPPAGMDQSWAPEEMQYQDPGTPGQADQLVSDPEAPSNFEEEPPPTGAFSPGESVKFNDPDTGRERYGFIVELKENGLYTVNFDDGTSKDLHEGWIMPAPEAPNADQQYNNYQQQDMSVAARIERAFFPKQATHQDWIDFKANEKEPQYGDWGEGSQYAEDRWDSPFAVNKNRRTPPLFTVKATVPDYHNPRSIAYALQTQLNKDVDVSGDTLTIKDVEQPWSLITERTGFPRLQPAA